MKIKKILLREPADPNARIEGLNLADLRSRREGHDDVGRGTYRELLMEPAPQSLGLGDGVVIRHAARCYQDPASGIVTRTEVRPVNWFIPIDSIRHVEFEPDPPAAASAATPAQQVRR